LKDLNPGKQVEILGLINEGNDLAKHGNEGEAVIRYEKAKALDPVTYKDFNSKDEAERWVRLGAFQRLFEEAKSAAAAQRIDEAIVGFRKAREVAPEFWGQQDPESLAQGIASQRIQPQATPVPQAPLPR